MIPIKSEREIEKMRTACKTASVVLERVSALLRPGITTREVEIDDVGSLCAFLVSDAARAITGDVHYIDGGYHILA